MKLLLNRGGGVEAMTKELEVLEANETWEITFLPPGIKAIRCWCVLRPSIGDMELLRGRKLG